ncbi:hypothetical protein Bca101_020371 [Brassica carinata]
MPGYPDQSASPRRGRSVPKPPHPRARTARTEIASPTGKDGPCQSHLTHMRGRTVPRPPRPRARTARTEVTSPTGVDDPH